MEEINNVPIPSRAPSELSELRSSQYAPIRTVWGSPVISKPPFPYQPTKELMAQELEARHLPQNFEIRNMISRYQPDLAANPATYLESEVIEEDLSEVTVFSSKFLKAPHSNSFMDLDRASL